MIDVVATAAPGIDDILVLGKVKQLERSGDYDLILVDGPAAGHAITFLHGRGRAASTRSTVGPIETQADDVLELLADPTRCQVVLVTLAEETPVNEMIETAFALEDRVGVALAPGRGQRASYPDRDAPEPSAVAGPRGRRTRRRCSDAAAPSAAHAGATAAPAARPARRRRCRSPRSPARPVHRRRSAPSDIDAARRLRCLDADRAVPVTGARRPDRPTRRIIVCCGPGGVGKTTTAARLGLEAARRGRRVVVVTIDPATRLADALGLGRGLTNEPAADRPPAGRRATPARPASCGR